MSKLFDKAFNKVSPEIKRFVENSFEIADQIHAILESKNKSQRELAELLKKSESEVSKWLTGTHNFTLKSISKIEIALGEKIIITPLQSHLDFLKRTEHATVILDTQNSFYAPVEDNNYKPIWAKFYSKSQMLESAAVSTKDKLESKDVHESLKAGENNYAMAA